VPSWPVAGGNAGRETSAGGTAEADGANGATADAGGAPNAGADGPKAILGAVAVPPGIALPAGGRLANHSSRNDAPLFGMGGTGAVGGIAPGVLGEAKLDGPPKPLGEPKPPGAPYDEYGDGGEPQDGREPGVALV